MRFRTGLVVGFATGFYVGSWAGRDRYQQINRAMDRVKQSDAFDAATGKAKAVVDLGRERAKDIVEAKRGRDSGSTPLAHAPGTSAVDEAHPDGPRDHS
jgi:hypothetical protein